MNRLDKKVCELLKIKALASKEVYKYLREQFGIEMYGQDLALVTYLILRRLEKLEEKVNR